MPPRVLASVPKPRGGNCWSVARKHAVMMMTSQRVMGTSIFIMAAKFAD